VDENEIKWDDFLKASEILNLKLINEIVYQYQLFDEVLLAKEFWLYIKVWKEEEKKLQVKKNGYRYSVISKKRLIYISSKFKIIFALYLLYARNFCFSRNNFFRL